MASASGQGGPSSTGYWIGGILLALGVLVAVALMASGVSQIVATVSEYRSMDTPGEESFVLDRGEYRIYLFNEGAGGADVQVLDVEGNALPLNRTLNSDEVTLDSVVLDFAGWFETPTDGIYTVVVESDATGGLLFGPPIGDSAVAAAGRAGLGALLGGLLFVAGVVVMIVTAVRRSRAKRPPSLAGPYQPYPAYQGYPGQGYPGQPYPPYQGQQPQGQPYPGQPHTYQTQAYPGGPGSAGLPPPPAPPQGAFAHPSAPVPGYPTAGQPNVAGSQNDKSTGQRPDEPA